jgi:osmotically-inducible protein OsmY
MAEEITTQIIDPEILETVTRAINDLVIVRESHPPLEIAVEKGVVTLEGTVLSNIMRRTVLYQAATTPGVQKVLDHLYEDPQLELAVARALAADAGLERSQPSIRVSSYQGVITLSGTIGDETERSKAEELASQTDGVRRVNNKLAIEAE